MAGIRLLVAALLLLPLGTACVGGGSEPDPCWQGTVIEGVPSDRVLWKATLYSCHKMGFTLPPGLDPSTMEVETAWRNDLQPFSGRGSRTQAHVVLRALERGKWRIEARVRRQTNENMREPLSSKRAKWEWTADDGDAARILVHHIRAYLAPAIEATDRPSDEIEALLQRAGLDEEDGDR